MPMANTLPSQPVTNGVLFPIDGTGIETISNHDRIIRNDPREAFFWSMPNKLTPQQCLQMLRAALAGDLFQQYNLCQLMLDTWPTFRMASHQLCESAAYMRYAVHPCAEEGKKPSKKAIEKADLVSRAIRSMTPDPFNDEKGFSGMAYALCDAMLNGLSLVELLWEVKASSDHGREWLPTSAAWVHPRHYTFSTAGSISLYNDDGNRVSPQTTGAAKGINPSPDKFVCAQFISKAGSSLGAGFMRPLVWYWAARQFNNEWMLNTAKQYGSPFIDITYKAGTVSTGPNSELEKLNEMLKTAGAQRRLIHPEGTTAVIHQPSSLGKENPQRVLEEKADEACLFLLLGQKGTTTAVSGQLGNDDSHENVKEERKLGVANWLARNPLRQFARAVLRRNYGNDDECPEVAPDTTKPLKTEQVGMLASAISSSGLPVRADEFYKKIGFTQPDEGEVVLVRGELMIQEAPMTKEDKFNEQLGQQVKQAEVQMELQGEAQRGQQSVQASERVKAIGGYSNSLSELAVAASRCGDDPPPAPPTPNVINVAPPNINIRQEAPVVNLPKREEQPIHITVEASEPVKPEPVNITLQALPGKRVVKGVERDEKGRLVGVHETVTDGINSRDVFKRVVRDESGAMTGVNEEEI
jgi:phage gp29-like protein